MFNDRHPEVELRWEKRSLRHFGEGSLAELARDYDLVLLDHPFIGDIARQKLFLSMEELAEPALLRDLAVSSVAGCLSHYQWENRHYALPVDAACQLSAYRADLLAARDIAVPATIDEVLELATNTGQVGLPLAPMGLWCSFLSLCRIKGARLFAEGDGIAPPDIAASALQTLHRLHDLAPAWMREAYPTTVLNRMSSTDDLLYVPFTFSYSVYCMEGYCDRPVTFGSIPAEDARQGPLGGAIGGVGVAISAASKHAREAGAFASLLAGGTFQRTLCVQAGGQPSHTSAWESPTANRLTNQFFARTRPAIENAFVRPRFSGFHAIQSNCAVILKEFLGDKISDRRAVEMLEDCFAGQPAHPL